MYGFAFRIVWPFLLRYSMKRAAEQAADFLNRRRDRRLRGEEEPEVLEEEPVECPPAVNGYSVTDVGWFTLSGVLIGSVIGVILTYIVKEEE